jgi:hypothetical protein
LPFFCYLLVLRFFLLLDDLLELFFDFWPSCCASCGRGFKIQTLCLHFVNALVKGEIEKLSGKYFGLICDEQLSCLGSNFNLRNFGGPILLSILCGETCVLVP